MKSHQDAAAEIELNAELVRLAKLLPSTDAGVEAGELISNAHANVTNLAFKRETITFVKNKFKEYLK